MRTLTSTLACAVAVLATQAGCDSLRNPDHPVLETAFAADGKAALFFFDGVGIADPELKTVRFVPYPVMPGWMRAVHALSRDGRRAVVSWNDEGYHAAPDGGVNPPRDKPSIDVFDVADGRLVRSFQVGHYALALSEDGARLVVAEAADTNVIPAAAALIAFNVDDGSQRWSVPGVFQSVVTIPGANAVAAMTFKRDLEAPPDRLVILDLDTGANRLEISLTDYPEGLAVSPDGGLLVLGRVEVTGASSANAHFTMINVADGATVRELSLPGRSPWENMAVSSGGRSIAAIVGLDGPSSDANPRGLFRELVLWDGDTVKMRTPTEVTGQFPATVALSPDGALLVSAQYNGVGLYDALTGFELARRSYKKNLF